MRLYKQEFTKKTVKVLSEVNPGVQTNLNIKLLVNELGIGKFCKKNNFKYCNVHSIRHYVATNLIYSGADVGTVSNVLGHSNLMTTLNTYANAFRCVNNQATDIMSSVVDEYIE